MFSPHVVPEPSFASESTFSFAGDIVVGPTPSGPTVTLNLVAPYEPILCLDGKRVTEATDDDSERALIWNYRRVPALFHILDLDLGLRGALDRDGVCIVDLVSLGDGVFLDHGQARRKLARARVRMPTWAILGPLGTRADLNARSRSMFASGTKLEVRCEDGGRVLSRQYLRVGR